LTQSSKPSPPAQEANDKANFPARLDQRVKKLAAGALNISEVFVFATFFINGGFALPSRWARLRQVLAFGWAVS
jgi:hypothetical protein